MMPSLLSPPTPSFLAARLSLLSREVRLALQLPALAVEVELQFTGEGLTRVRILSNHTIRGIKATDCVCRD